MVIFTPTFYDLTGLQFEEHALLWRKFHGEEHLEQSNCVDNINDVHLLVVSVLAVFN